MSEEENTNVATEEVQEVVQPEESTDAQEQAQESPEQRRERNDAEHNWAETRKQMRNKDLKIAELEDQISSLTRKAAPPPAPEVDELAGLAKDDFLTVEQAEKVAERKARKLFDAMEKERNASTADERLQSKFPDFGSTVTRENIELLKELKPDVAESLTLLKDDPYRQAKLAYEYIKAFVPQQDESMTKDRKKAETNSKKPLSVQAVSKQSPIAQSHLFEDGPLTQERKNAIYKQMLQDMKGY